MRRLLLGLLSAMALTTLLSAKADYPGMGPDIFDPKVPGELLVDQAFTQAAREKKVVLLFIGTNWCPWSRRIHGLFTSHPAVTALLRERYVLVHIDANTRNDRKRNAALLERFGDPAKKHGIPVFVVISEDGTRFSAKDTAPLAAVSDEETASRILKLLRDALSPQ